MRPDEHKKKKNAAYKKKHGIGQTKGQVDDNTKSKKSSNVKVMGQPQRSKDEDREGRSSLALKGKDAAEAVDVDSSGSETEEVKPHRKTYQRRQIVSNWQKYEIQPEEKETSRGESFEKLLSMAGDGLAHFRFKDEQEWDMDSSLTDDQCGQYLNVDTQQIGQSLACLPVYQMLGLNPDIFPEEEIATMEKTAAENRQMYLGSEQQTSTVCEKNTRQIENETQNELSKSYTHSSTSNQHHQQIESLQNGGELGNSSSEDKTTLTARDNNVKASESSDASQRLCLDDEDLDALLDTDYSNGTTTLKDAEVREQRQLTPSSSVSSKATKPKAVNSTTDRKNSDSSQVDHSKHNPTKDGVDLEDWLDSILDD